MGTVPFVLLVVFVLSSGRCNPLNENIDVNNELIEVPEKPVAFIDSDLSPSEKADAEVETDSVLLIILKNPVVNNPTSEIQENIGNRRVARQATLGYPSPQTGYYSNNPYSTPTPLYPSIDNLKYPYGNQSPSGPTYRPSNYTYPHYNPGTSNNNIYNPSQGPYNPNYRPASQGNYNSTNYGHVSHNTYPKTPYPGNYSSSFNPTQPTNRPYYSNNTNRPHALYPNYPTPNQPSWSKPNNTNLNFQTTPPPYYNPGQAQYNPNYRPSGNMNYTNYGHSSHNTGYPTSGYQYANGQNIPYNTNQQQWNKNPIQNGTNTFRLTNSYNPNVPNQPPYNSNLGQNQFYSSWNRNATWQNPTKY